MILRHPDDPTPERPVASPAAPQQASVFSRLRRAFIGETLSTRRIKHQKLPKFLALPVFSSDAISSSAYATEEMILVLWAGGAAALHLSVGTGCAVALLLAIVAFSYCQTVNAYPQGGGSFIVSSENIGPLFGLSAASALLIGYVLTVAVSIAAGAAALTSAVPSLLPYRLPLCLLFVALVTLANLRGAKESGTLFAPPTYGYIGLILLLVGVGWWKAVSGQLPAAPFQPYTGPTHPLTAFLVLTAFARGCAALTGTEAIADGVQAFRPPESRNAAITLVWMTVILGVLFLGISLLASQLGVVPGVDECGEPVETLVSRLGRTVLGVGPLYYVLQAATMAILVLAANTAYVDFPRLSSILAGRGYAPRQMANLGDRLVFSNGIIVLGIISAVTILIFRGDTHALIPLYALGVFLSFTLSQAGMVRRWLRLRTPRWQFSAALNGIGACTTGVVFLVQAAVNFHDGSWAVLLTIPVGVWILWRIRNHYEATADALTMEGHQESGALHHTVVVVVPDVHRGVMHALRYAKAISGDVEAVYVNTQPTTHEGIYRRVLKATPEPLAPQLEVVSEAVERLRERWDRWTPEIPLVVLDSEYRSLADPLLEYLDGLSERKPVDTITVVIPEFVPQRWWHHALHNQSGLALKRKLGSRANVVVANVRYFLGASEE